MILNYTIKEIRQTGGSKRPPSAKRPESALAQMLKQQNNDKNNWKKKTKTKKYTNLKLKSKRRPRPSSAPLKSNIKSPSNPGSAPLIPVVEIVKQDTSLSPSPPPSPSLSPPIELTDKPPEHIYKPKPLPVPLPAEEVKKAAEEVQAKVRETEEVKKAAEEVQKKWKIKSKFIFPFPVPKLGVKQSSDLIIDQYIIQKYIFTNIFKKIGEIGQIQPNESQKKIFIEKMETLIKLNNPQKLINKKYTNMFTNNSTNIYHKVNNEYIETDLSQIENQNKFDIVKNIFDILQFFKRKKEDNHFDGFIPNMIKKSILLSENIFKFYNDNEETIIQLMSENNKDSLYNKLWTSYKDIVDNQYIEDINTISGCNENIEKIEKDNFENLQNVKIKVLSYHIDEWEDKLMKKTVGELSLEEFKNIDHENIKLYYKCI